MVVHPAQPWLNWVTKCDITEMRICEIMGFVVILYETKMKNASVPKISVFAPIDSEPRKNNRFPFLDILGFLKNTHKNSKFGRVRQVSTRELMVGNSLVGTWLTLTNLGFLCVFFKYPKISNIGNLLFFPVEILQS